MSEVKKPIDQAHLLPPDKLSTLTAVVFAKWNQPFKVVSVKKQLNGTEFKVSVRLKTGALKPITV